MNLASLTKDFSKWKPLKVFFTGLIDIFVCSILWDWSASIDVQNVRRNLPRSSVKVGRVNVRITRDL